MWTITRRSPVPPLRFVAGGIACQQEDALTVYPFSSPAPVTLRVAPVSGGGYGVILADGTQDRTLAQYPQRRQAERQLRQLFGHRPSPWRWVDRLGRVSLMAVLAFVVWFLFFLPVDPAYQALSANPTAWPEPANPASVGAAPSATPAPAWIDDPAESVSTHGQ
ncbi:MAG: hypothetical protein H6970_15540 [Gammaproteobacteria bacterium]|nr:hypothetical protein [Gammaproteobacteria bacterium]MCP5426457.1 hypothetical protein [Gammaproteobacteria bacterium]MCP5458695.1 hypothetical protein [Gammaproteobacteria bacterium]